MHHLSIHNMSLALVPSSAPTSPSVSRLSLAFVHDSVRTLTTQYSSFKLRVSFPPPPLLCAMLAPPAAPTSQPRRRHGPTPASQVGQPQRGSRGGGKGQPASQAANHFPTDHCTKIQTMNLPCEKNSCAHILWLL
jgi:hypothetical protein